MATLSMFPKIKLDKPLDNKTIFSANSLDKFNSRKLENYEF